MTTFAATFVLRDAWTDAARLVQAVPADWQLFQGRLEAPPDLEPVPGIEITIRADTPCGTTITNHANSAPGGQLLMVQFLAGRPAQHVDFSVNRDLAGTRVAKGVAVHCLEKRYAGRLKMRKGRTNPEGMTWISHASCTIAIEASIARDDAKLKDAGRVELVWSDEDCCKGTADDIAPLLAMCRELGLVGQPQS